MKGYKKIDPQQMEGNVFEKIGSQWMLITAGNEESYNTMTASWGGMGVLWNKNVVFAFVRPGRYTRQFMDREKQFTLSFFCEGYKKALAYCGRVSGRDADKAKECGLTPVEVDGSIAFAEAEMIIKCRTIATDNIHPEGFEDMGIEDNYPEKDYHIVYIGEIEGVYVK